MAMMKEYNRVVSTVKIENIFFTDEENKTWEDFRKLVDKLAGLNCENDFLGDRFMDLAASLDDIEEQILD